MKQILTILLLLFICFIGKSQYTVPRGSPLTNGAYYNYTAPSGYVLFDSAILFRNSDTLMKPLYPSIKFKSNLPYYWNGTAWVAFSAGSSTVTLQDAYDNSVLVGEINPNITVDNGGFYVRGLDANNRINAQNSGDGTLVTMYTNGSTKQAGFTVGTNSFKVNLTNFQTGMSSGAGYVLMDVNGDGNLTLEQSFGATGNVYYAIDSTNTPPGSPATDDVYMVGGAGTGAWSGHNYDIATWNGSAWVFTDPSANDLAVVTSTKKTYRYNGSTWIISGGIPLLVGGNNITSLLQFGTLSNSSSTWITNGINRIRVTNAGTIQFIPLTGASAGIMGLSTTGVASNIQIGSGLQLSGGVLSSTSTTPGLQDVITEDPVLTANNTITGSGLSLSFDPFARFTINVSDSIRFAASNNIGLNSLATVNIRGLTIDAKAITSQFGSTTTTLLHYETGASDSIYLKFNSVGAFWKGIITSDGAAYKPLQQDTVTGQMIRKLIDVSNNTAQITGVGNVANGFTGQSSLTANNLIVGNGTSPVTFIAPGTSGNILTSNGTSWVSSAAAAQLWTKGSVSGVSASTNILQPTTLTDSIAAGTLTALNARYNFGGTASFYSTVAIGNFAQDANYKVKVGIGAVGSIYTTGNVQFDALASIGTASAAVAGQTLTIAGSTISAITGTHTQSTNSTNYTAFNFTVQNSMTTAAGGNTAVLASVSNLTDQSVSQTSALYRGVFSSITTNSGSTTPITTAVGVDAYIRGNSGASRTQTFTTVYGFRSQDIASAYPTGGMLTSGGNFYQFFADSSLAASFAGGSMYGFYQRTNTANNINNIFQGKTSIGTSTTPTAMLMLGAGTTSIASARYLPGVAPSSPNDGDRWYEDTNDRMMFRQNTTSVEILGVSAVNTVSPTAQNRTITVSINGVPYYITAKTTND